MNEFSLISNDELMVYGESESITRNYYFSDILRDVNNYVIDSCVYYVSEYLDISFKQPSPNYYDSSINKGININSSIDSSTYAIAHPLSIKKQNGMLSMTPGYGDIIISSKNNAVIDYIEFHKTSGPSWKVSRWNNENTNISLQYSHEQYDSCVNSLTVNTNGYLPLNNISFSPVNSDETYNFDYVKIAYSFHYEDDENYLKYSDGSPILYDNYGFVSYDH